MAQRDYVGRGRSTGTRRKSNNKGNSRSKKQSGGSGVSKLMMGAAAAVLVAFAGGLWFIAHHKKDDEPVITADHKKPANTLPPKPEERWRYIKELENRQLTVPTPTEPSSGNTAPSKPQLTAEQRQLLEQMQADMQQQPTHLNEVPWNDQTPAQRQQTLQQQSRQSQPTRAPQPQPSQVKSSTAQQQHMLPKPQQQTRVQQPVQTTTQPKAESKPAQTTTLPKVESKPATKAPQKRWMVQCGSFKGTEQAESVRAALAFEGFESRITTGGGWNRVVIGPYNNRAGADSTLKRLRNSGHANCIPLAIGG